MKEYIKKKILECRTKTKDERKQVARELTLDLYHMGYTPSETADMILDIMQEIMETMKC